MIIPEMINPIIPGTLIGLRRMGDSRIMKRTREKMSTGLVSGASKA